MGQKIVGKDGLRPLWKRKSPSAGSFSDNLDAGTAINKRDYKNITRKHQAYYGQEDSIMSAL